MRWRRPGFTVPLLEAAVIITACLPATAWPQFPTRSTASAPSAVQPIPFAAVVGQIRRPGVYELAPNTRLTELISRAGGLPASASGNIRIVRNGRSGIHTFLDPKTPKSKIMVRPGDVVVADAFHSRSSWRGSTTVSQRRSESIPVHIGIVNLVNRPVVLPVWGQYSTVGGVLNMLGQPPGLADRLRLESAAHTLARRRKHSVAKRHVQLVSGDVLVLDQLSVHSDQIPVTLPQTYRLARQATTAPNPGSAPTLRSQSERGTGQHTGPVADRRVPVPLIQPGPHPAARIASNPTSGPSTEPGQPLKPAPLGRPLATPTPASDPGAPSVANPHALAPHTADDSGIEAKPSQPAIGTVTDAAPSPQTTKTTNQGTTIGSAETNPVAQTTATSVRRPADPTPGTRSATSTPSDSRLTTTQWVFYAVIYSAVVAMLAAGLLLWQIARTNTSRRSSTKPQTEEPEIDPLEALVQNQLNIYEESLAFPAHLTFHGRPCREPRYRIDARHEFAGPHVGSSDFVAQHAGRRADQDTQAPETAPSEPDGSATADADGTQTGDTRNAGPETAAATQDAQTVAPQPTSATATKSSVPSQTPSESHASGMTGSGSKAIPRPNALRHFIKAAQDSRQEQEADDNAPTRDRNERARHGLEQESLLDRALNRVHGAQT